LHGTSASSGNRRRTAPLATALAAVALLACAPPAQAWGAEGHRIVGLVAEQLLDPRARDALRQLVGEESLADLGLWMDEERGRLRATLPGSERWHFDNRPVCGGTAADCAHGDCASQAYARELAVLRDRSAPPAARATALRIVVHVLADVHQPLHAADHDDRGGNDLLVNIGRRARPKPLHRAWDSDFVKRAVRGEAQARVAAGLVAEYRSRIGPIQSGELRDWMDESTAIARDYAYGRLPGFACGAQLPPVVQLPPEYADGAAGIVRERLARAGIRLAGVLNSAL
jgi:hypothetical protein